MHQAGFVVPKSGLETLGLKNLSNVYWNLQVPALYEEAVRRREGVVAEGGALVVRTGIHTGRSPNDKFIVEDAESKGRIDWGKTNKAITPEQFANVKADFAKALADKKTLYVQDLYGGSQADRDAAVAILNTLRATGLAAPTSAPPPEVTAPETAPEPAPPAPVLAPANGEIAVG